MRISDWSSDVCSSDLLGTLGASSLGQVAGVGPIGDIAQLGAGAYLQSFSREQEFEADTLGVRYLAQAGYDTQAMATFLRKMQAYSRLQAKRSEEHTYELQ